MPARNPQPGPEEIDGLARHALAESGRREDALAFLQQRIHPRPGRAWSLDRHEYLRAIVLDPARIVVAKKAAQLGLSTYMIAEMLRTCLAGYNAGYFLDTSDRMKRFVQSRFDPIINSDAELVRQVVDGSLVLNELATSGRKRRGGNPADNVHVKRIGQGTCYFLTTKVMGDVKTVDLDLICMDEVAELDDDKADFAQDRLLHSDLKLQRWISQPDVPGMDIDAWYQRSDQKHWLLHCPKCGQHICLELSFPDCLWQKRPSSSGTGVHACVPGTWAIGCPKCHVELDPSSGEWVSSHPGRPISGYQISQLYGPHITADEIAEQWEQAQLSPRKMRRFQISILGEAYAGDRQPMTQELLRTCCGDWGIAPMPSTLGPRGDLYIGFDQGDTMHLVVGRLSDALRIVWMEETSDWDLIAHRIESFEMPMFAGDAMPYKPSVKALLRKFKRGVMVYSSAQRTHYGIEDEKTDPLHFINVNRTEYMDQVGDAFRSHFLWLPSPLLPETQTAILHLTRFVKDGNDDGSYSYKRKVDNHYGMALANLLVAIQGQTALNLAPAGHFEPFDPRPGRQHPHMLGESLLPREW